MFSLEKLPIMLFNSFSIIIGMHEEWQKPFNRSTAVTSN